MTPASLELKKKVVSRLVLAPVVLGMVLFLPAGTFRYWQAWVFMAVLIIPMVSVMLAAERFVFRRPRSAKHLSASLRQAWRRTGHGPERRVSSPP